MVRIYHRVVDTLNFIAAATIVAIMLLMVLDILLRVAFRSPIHGVPEIVKMAVIGIAWWQIPYALKNRNHLRSTLILDALPPIGKGAVYFLNSVAGVILMALIVWFAYPEMVRAWNTGSFEGEHPMRIPTWPIWGVIVSGAALAAFEYLIQAIQSLAGALQGQRQSACTLVYGAPARSPGPFMHIPVNPTPARATMDPLTIGMASVVVLFILILIGFHIGIALAATSFVSVYFIMGERLNVASSLLRTTAYSAVGDYVYAVIPLFILMGLCMTSAGVTRDLFNAAEVLMRRMRGGLGVATVASNAVFAAITGVSVASAAVFSKLAVPEMRRLNYNLRLQPRHRGLVFTARDAIASLDPHDRLCRSHRAVDRRDVCGWRGARYSGRRRPVTGDHDHEPAAPRAGRPWQADRRRAT